MIQVEKRIGGVDGQGLLASPHPSESIFIDPDVVGNPLKLAIVVLGTAQTVTVVVYQDV